MYIWQEDSPIISREWW